MNKNFARLIIIALFSASFIACTKTTLSSDGSQNLLSNTGYYINESSKIKVYWKNSGVGTFVTQLNPIAGAITVPSSVLVSTDYGNRTNAKNPANLDLVASVYFPNHPSGDFYFETPILGPQATITNVTTALFWYLKWGFEGVPVKISQSNFDQMVLNIEVGCEKCRKKTNSQVLELIKANESLLSFIRSSVISENPTLNLASKNWITPKAFWGWATPSITQGSGFLDTKENTKVDINVLYVNPLDSTNPVKAKNWLDSFSNQTTISSSDGSFSKTLGYDESGKHTITPIFEASTEDGATSVIIPNDSISFTMSASDVNRLPVCSDSIQIPMRANVISSVTLTAYCSDLDPDNTSLSFALDSGPVGLVISSAGVIKWTPSASFSNTSTTIKFRATDSSSGITLVTAQINVTPDRDPTFNVLLSSYDFTEGVEASFTVSAIDPDGDPLVLNIVPDGPIYAGYPLGSGNLTNITRTGSNGSYSFLIKFKPDYRQTIGGNGITSLKFKVSYDGSDNSYDPNIFFDERSVEFNILNIDDPPTWNVDPTSQTVIEGTDIGSVVIGQVTDPAPNSTAMTYQIKDLSSEENCEWGKLLTVSVSGTDLVLSGIPPFYSYELCKFALQVPPPTT